MEYYCIYKDIVEKDADGWVYLVKAEGTSRYKIGRSKDPVKRYQSLRRQSPYPLSVINSFYTLNAVADEKHLHLLFTKHRVYGEWFEFPHELNIEDFFKEKNFDRSETNSKILRAFLKMLLNRENFCFTDKQKEDIIHVAQKGISIAPYEWILATDSFESILWKLAKTGVDPVCFTMGFLNGVVMVPLMKEFNNFVF